MAIPEMQTTKIGFRPIRSASAPNGIATRIPEGNNRQLPITPYYYIERREAKHTRQVAEDQRARRDYVQLALNLAHQALLANDHGIGGEIVELVADEVLEEVNGGDIGEAGTELNDENDDRETQGDVARGDRLRIHRVVDWGARGHGWLNVTVVDVDDTSSTRGAARASWRELLEGNH